MILHLEKEMADGWAGDCAFKRARQQQGEVFRNKENRRTLRFSIGEKNYFLKLHRGIGWREIIKNLLLLKLPVISARNEWRAIQKLHRLNLHTMTAVAFGSRGINPAKKLSFLITKELPGTISLAELCAKWAEQPPGFAFKRAVITQVAEIARTLHENGVNHRDFYLCHFLADISMGRENLATENLRLYLIDLHRAQIRKKTPRRWMIKDIGGLYFSAFGLGLGRRDLLRFMKTYSRETPRRLLQRQDFWRKVVRRAKKIYRRDCGGDGDIVTPW